MIDFSESMKNKGYNFTTKRLPEGHSWGLWRATTDLILKNIFPVITSRVGTSKKTVNKINLLQNYPNPFNPITNIIVESKQSIKINLFLYNIKGEKVKNIAKSEYINGNKSFVVDMSKLSSGIYFAVLTSDNISKSIKILFLK